MTDIMLLVARLGAGLRIDVSCRKTHYGGLLHAAQDCHFLQLLASHMNTVPSEPLLSQTEAARALRVSIDTVRRWRKRGTGPAFVTLPMVGPRYSREAIDAFLARRESE